MLCQACHNASLSLAGRLEPSLRSPSRTKIHRRERLNMSPTAIRKPKYHLYATIRSQTVISCKASSLPY
ncbi:hypothetical protein CC80DRAFT_66785 [Byssothecium circinans]|uniref:Uncharacterized protein n=1 Tax=Byssothecium circinans TaxID=147558 RepID=A0A6A5TVZ6_9PLEO|nr:hypothetical protein CC80DRAFT_66785 [Byssothecium circinans]